MAGKDSARPDRPVFLRVLLTLAPALLLGACAGQSVQPETQGWSDESADCLAQFNALDEEIESAGARDHGEYRPDGWPWLRSTRLLASLGADLGDPSAQKDDWEDWLEALAAVDAEARRWELANLQGHSPFGSGQGDSRLNEALDGLADCRAALNRDALAQPEALESLREAAQVPDEYRSAWRWFGAYPVTRLIVLSGVNRLHQDQMAALEGPAWPRRGGWREYLAEPSIGESSEAAAIAPPPYSDINIPPRGLKLPSNERIQALFERHAPVWRVEESGDFDRIGRPEFDDDGDLTINTETPVEFRYLSHTRFGDEVLLQLNYMVWFPERPADGRLDLLAGDFDGAIWRVTLNEGGQALAGESLHVCGCYYMVFPGSGMEAGPQPAGGEPIFVGPKLPTTGEDERIRLSRESRSHYLIQVDSVPAGRNKRTALAVRDANELRSLPHDDGRQSLYGKGGLVPGSERAERYLLWTMGVPSPGALRQPGRHAIAFAGRRHFDDPRILEESLERRADQ